jgi:hypothetical protein
MAPRVGQNEINAEKKAAADLAKLSPRDQMAAQLAQLRQEVANWEATAASYSNQARSAHATRKQLEQFQKNAGLATKNALEAKKRLGALEQTFNAQFVNTNVAEIDQQGQQAQQVAAAAQQRANQQRASSPGIAADPTPAVPTFNDPTPQARQLSADEIRQLTRARFGYIGALLDFPDVFEVLQRAYMEGMSNEDALRALKNTNTFQTHQEAELEWITLKQVDKNAAADVQRRVIGNLAASLGVQIHPDRLNQLADDAAKFKWDALKIREAVSAEFHYKPGQEAGQLASRVGDIRRWAQDHLVPMSDSTLEKWQRQWVTGEVSDPEVYLQHIKNQAKSLFPVFAKQLDTASTRELVDPYWQVAAQELGINPEAIDIMQPKWEVPFYQRDDKNQPILMNLADWRMKIRNDDAYGWDKSQNGIQAGFRTARGVLRAIGELPGGAI